MFEATPCYRRGRGIASEGRAGSKLLSPAATTSSRILKDLFHVSADRAARRACCWCRVWPGRQVPACLGVLQVHRRPCRGGPLALRAMSLLRRRSELLGAGRRWSEAGSAWGVEEEAPRDVCRRALASGPGGAVGSPIRVEQRVPPPRLTQLLGLLEPREGNARSCFAGWRLFFERLAEHLPVVMVVEDLQWADARGSLSSWTTCSSWSEPDHPIFLPGPHQTGGCRPQRAASSADRNIATLSARPTPRPGAMEKVLERPRDRGCQIGGP